MPAAYILLNTVIGAENHVLKALKKVEGVEEAKRLYGVYDIIAHVKADTMEGLKHILTNKIESIGKINTKLTMLITDKAPFAPEGHVFFEQTPMIQ